MSVEESNLEYFFNKTDESKASCSFPNTNKNENMKLYCMVHNRLSTDCSNLFLFEPLWRITELLNIAFVLIEVKSQC